MDTPPPNPPPADSARSDTAARTVVHSLAWLLFANIVGAWLAAILVWPDAGRLLGHLTYGRWATLHLNLHLYGWCSLPFVGLLLRAYLPAGDHRGANAALQAWTGALVFASVSWLAGDTSGKPFVEWAGPPRFVMPAAMLFLALVLARGYVRGVLAGDDEPRARRAAKLALLAGLLAVPYLLYRASDPSHYPPVNPDSGGATGGSLLGSTLGIVAVILVYPWLARLPRNRRDRWPHLVGGVFVLHALWYAMLDHGDRSHHEPAQVLALCSLVVWIPLLVPYLRRFTWPRGARIWLAAFGGWGAALVITALITFLPGVLERWKFTHALVAHTHMAMAGMVTCLAVLVLLAQDDERRWSPAFTRAGPFAAWHLGLLAHVLALLLLGTVEGEHPAMLFFAEGPSRWAFAIRLAAGMLMTWASYRWLALVCRSCRRVPTNHPSALPPQAGDPR